MNDPRRALLDGALLAAFAWTVAGTLGVLRLANLSELRDLWLAALAGAVLARRRPAVPRALAAAALAALLVVVFTPIGPALLRAHIRRDPPSDAVDAVAVLSGDVRSDGLLAERSVDRLLSGLRRAQTLDRPLLLSAIRADPRAPSSEADQRRLAALAGRRDVLFVDSVASTRDEAVRFAAVARARGWRRVLLVTSPSHSRRACAAVERAGLPVVCAPAEAREYALGGPRPAAGARERVGAFRDWLYEAVAALVYRARGWV